MVAPAKKWMGVTLLATLVIGVGIGILVDRFVLAATSSAHSTGGDVDRRGGREHGERGRRMVERLRSGLELTEEQVVLLEAVMNENHETAHEFWKSSRQRYEALRGQFRADIRALLSEDQQSKFDEMVAEYDAKRRDREDRHGDR